MLRVLLCCGLLFSGNLLAKEIPALLDWQQRMELGTLLDGMVSKVNVGIGQQVNRGSLLIELDQREIQARLAWAESRVAAAKLQQDEARRELDRSLELYDRTLLSNHERILAEIEAARADAYALQTDAELAEIRKEREYARIKAPFDGIVVNVMAQPGQVLVNRLQSIPLVILADPSRMKALAQVDAATAAGLSVGDTVKVDVQGESLDGEIILIGLEPFGSDASGVAEYALEVIFTPKQGMQLRVGEQVVVRIDD
jgi:multidrug efflux system membrane fusion protein